MGLLSDSVDKLKELSSSEAIDCPRGHGAVKFQVAAEGMLPFFSLTRSCPIGGVGACVDCRHPLHPDRLVGIDAALTALDEQKRRGVLTQDEAEAQRRSLLSLRRINPPGFGLTIAAWVLGSAGLFLGGFGVWLAREFAVGFWGLAGAGGLMIAVAIGLAFGAAYARRDEVGRRHE